MATAADGGVDDDTGRDEPTTQNEELIGVLRFVALRWIFRPTVLTPA